MGENASPLRLLFAVVRVMGENASPLRLLGLTASCKWNTYEGRDFGEIPAGLLGQRPPKWARAEPIDSAKIFYYLLASFPFSKLSGFLFW
jgi:hypothetical protein